MTNSFVCVETKVAGGWIMSLSACLAAVYTVVPFQASDHTYSPLLDSLYISLHRNIFSLGVSGVVLLCVFQRGGRNIKSATKGYLNNFTIFKNPSPLGTADGKNMIADLNKSVVITIICNYEKSGRCVAYIKYIEIYVIWKYYKINVSYFLYYSWIQF